MFAAKCEISDLRFDSNQSWLDTGSEKKKRPSSSAIRDKLAIQVKKSLSPHSETRPLHRPKAFQRPFWS